MKPALLTNINKSLSDEGVTNLAEVGVKVSPTPVPDNKDELRQVLPLKKGRKVPAPFTVVAIGASAGGLEAITELLQNLSPDTGMAFIYVQHLSPDHKSLLTPLLSKVTKMKVQDIEDMDRMQPDNVYVIPYNKDIEVTNGHIKIIPRSGNKYANLSIDVLFCSLAETHKENVIGIVLSGAASDGTRGLKEIKRAGGITFAQDDSAKFSSMPKSAIAEGVVDFILSPKEIAEALTSMTRLSLAKRKAAVPEPEEEIENSDSYYKTIFQLLYIKKNIDFSHYKMNTIKRRILRKMVMLKIKTLKLYAGFLLQNDNEVELLYQDLLINVTGFFRDLDAFLVLKNTVLPRLLKNKARGETLRIWVAACATGEEVYSIAMMLSEILESTGNAITFQIFASDLSIEAINEARIGEYSMQQLKNISPERLQLFFTKFKDKYRVSRILRDSCVFAQHNILSDPPFSHIDFISCRNLLIYLDTVAQRKIIATLHYALNDDGCLILGKSETIGTSGQLFTCLDEKFKIYIRKKNSGARRIPDITPLISYMGLHGKNNVLTKMTKKMPVATIGNLGDAFDAVLLEHYVPASVIINHNMEILQFRGSTSLYLRHSSGRANFNILKMASIEMAFELRNAIHHAIKTNQIVRKSGIEMNRDLIGNTLHMVDLEVMPLNIEGEEPLLVVVFSGQQVELTEQTIKGDKNNSILKDRRIRKLEEELASARADMVSITHDQEAANEELQCANEEIVSSNEELQSLNEELETSKEEIESTNEELTSSNQELHTRIQQVEDLYNYHEVILATVHEPMLILDKNIRIKSVNKSFCKTFHVSEEESIGISLYKLGNNQWDILRLRELLEDIVPKNIRFHDFEVEHTFPVIGHKTMLLNAHRIIQQSQDEELIVLTISDITEVKRMAVELQEKEKRALIEAKNIAEQEKQIAEVAVKAKQQFLSNMSHEIRTPMNAIIGFTNVVLKTKLDESQTEYLNAIKIAGDALIVLINDILDLARVDSGKMTFEQVPFDLNASISTMLRLFATKIKDKNLEFVDEYDTAIPQILLGDPVRLRQIILNLVSNAVKFTAKGTITMRVRMLEEDKEKVKIEFTLTDTGIGIAKDKMEVIFNNFEQANAGTSGSYGGSGLGLAIVKQFVELQGGSLIVSSEPGIGSTFGFILSFKKTGLKEVLGNGLAPEVDSKDSVAETGIRNVKVLVVEDVSLNQLLIKIILLDFGFDIDVAANGQVAIEYMQKSEYDIILMDLHMPVMNGFEATSFIRNKMNSQIPIIALTADVTTVDVEKCLAVGMNDYISKPIDEKLLFDKITRVLKKPLTPPK